MIHNLKILKKYADAVNGNAKHFEVRKNDRNFQIGDVVTFTVIDDVQSNPLNYKAFFISYVLTHEDFPDGIAEGYCVFTIAPLDDGLSFYYSQLRENENG